MNSPESSPLGKPVVYGGSHDASLLHPIARDASRQPLALAGDRLPFVGADLWTAYELGWLNPRGKPQVAIAQITVPCESPAMVESKSFKLYLGSFSQTRFADAQQVRERIRDDVTAAAGAGVGVRLLGPELFDQQQIREPEGLSLDRLDIECDRYHPEPAYLRASFDEQPVEELLTSHLLRSNCPVTGQPDWGSISIAYTGPQIDQGGLLRYLVSFREHSDFHEHCVERIFTDLWRHCRPARLSVYARYTRRGGLDINPWRASHPGPLPASVRTARQ